VPRLAFVIALVALLLAACGGSTTDDAAVVSRVLSTATTDSAAAAENSPAALHRNPAPRSTPTPQSHPLRPSAATPTLAPQPIEYVDPVLGIELAFEKIFGHRPQFWDKYQREIFVDRALLVRNLYHLATAESGSYNVSLDGYVEWLMGYVEYWFSPPSANKQARFKIERSHVYRQVNIALTRPESPIGSYVRSMEVEANRQQPGSGPLAVWELVIGPALDPAFLTSDQSAMLERSFFSLVSAYQRGSVHSGQIGELFVDYLASTSFAGIFDDRSTSPRRQAPQSTPTPARGTRTPSPSQSHAPREGRIVLSESLSSRPAVSSEYGWKQPTSRSLVIGVYPGDTEHVIEDWTDRSDFRDISASVELRSISTNSAAQACLSVRHDVADGDFSFCILATGRIWAGFYYVDPSGQWQKETLVRTRSTRHLNRVAEWNTLKIIVSGDTVWLYVNDQLIATTRYVVRTSGAVAVSVLNSNSRHDAKYEFRNLVVRDVN
jgi:hypothetical protein